MWDRDWHRDSLPHFNLESKENDTGVSPNINDNSRTSGGYSACRKLQGLMDFITVQYHVLTVERGPVNWINLEIMLIFIYFSYKSYKLS